MNSHNTSARRKRGLGRQKIRSKLPPFVPLSWELLNSRAYKDLTPAAAKELPYFLGKVKVKWADPQKYLTAFAFSYKEAEGYGFARATHHRIICELVKKGFINPVEKGGLRGCGRSYNLFQLSQRWKKYGDKEFEERMWRTFQPKIEQKPSSKMETYRFKNGKNRGSQVRDSSKSEPVGAFLP